jgi:hypothetical protein
MKPDANTRNRIGNGTGPHKPDQAIKTAVEDQDGYAPFTEPLALASDDAGKLTTEVQALLADMAAQFPCRSLVDFAEAEIDDTKTLLGKRFLCIGGGLLVVAPTGVGKSTATTSMATNWSCGKPAFGIRPKRPLKFLIVQAENDDGDMSEMTRDLVEKLSAEERALVHSNTACVHIDNLSADNFIYFLSLLLKKHEPDIVLIDPFNAFSGGDPSNPTTVTTFLRNWLNPLLNKHQCAAIIVHHTPKTRNWDTSKWKPNEWAYAAAGNNDMSNWARAIMVLDATDDPDLYRFVLAKRGKRAGWTDDFGGTAYVRYFTRSKEGIRWSDASPEQVAELEETAKEKKQGRKQKYTNAKLLKPLLGDEDGLSFADLLKKLNHDGCEICQSTLWGRVMKCETEGLVEKLGGDLWVLTVAGRRLFDSLRQKSDDIPKRRGDK